MKMKTVCHMPNSRLLDWPNSLLRFIGTKACIYGSLLASSVDRQHHCSSLINSA